MLYVADFSGRIFKVSDSLQDISVTSLKELRLEKTPGDYVTSMSQISNRTYFGTLAGAFFCLPEQVQSDDESQSIDLASNVLTLDSQVREIVSQRDVSHVVTEKNYYQIDQNGRIVSRLPTPTERIVSTVDFSERRLFAFFDQRIYELPNGDNQFNKIKTLSRVVYNIVATPEHYYLACGIGSNPGGKLVITDKNWQDIGVYRYKEYVLATKAKDGRVLVGSLGTIDVFENGRLVGSKKICNDEKGVNGKRKIRGILVPGEESQHYALVSAGNTLYSVGEDLNVRLTRIFPDLITCVR